MLNLGLTRFLPAPLAEALNELVGIVVEGRQLIRLRPRQARAYEGKSVAVVGFFSTRCGLQRAAELMVLDLARQGVRVVRCDVSSLLGLTRNLFPEGVVAPQDLAAAGVTDIFMHVPGHMAAPFLNALGQRAYRSMNLFAYWHWETQKVPRSWYRAALLMDEIWTPTPFVRDAFAYSFPKLSERLRIVPNAIMADPFSVSTPAERAAARTRLGLAPNVFVAGFTFSMSSCFERKNPLAALEAFSLAFPAGTEPAAFLMRCHEANDYPDGRETLRARAEVDPRIVLIDTPERDVAVRDFYAAIDTLVTLHRSEGYGLTIAEATQSGARAIVTDWGLAPDLASLSGVREVTSVLIPLRDPQRIYEPGPETLWADPDIVAAARILAEDAAAFRAEVDARV